MTESKHFGLPFLFVNFAFIINYLPILKNNMELITGFVELQTKGKTDIIDITADVQ
ncbi:MAG: hypothetical protein ABII90_00630 [Bacteroidota bacterium]